jgi:hypothetical protein
MILSSSGNSLSAHVSHGSSSFSFSLSFLFSSSFLTCQHQQDSHAGLEVHRISTSASGSSLSAVPTADGGEASRIGNHNSQANDDGDHGTQEPLHIFPFPPSLPSSRFSRSPCFLSSVIYRKFDASVSSILFCAVRLLSTSAVAVPNEANAAVTAGVIPTGEAAQPGSGSATIAGNHREKAEREEIQRIQREREEADMRVIVHYFATLPTPEAKETDEMIWQKLEQRVTFSSSFS